MRDPSRAIAALRNLYGVDWAVGSVFLHLAHRDPFPILDYRALQALGVPRGQAVSNLLWLDYVAVTRSLAQEAGVDARTLDRALWQWSKEQVDLPATSRRGRRTAVRDGTRNAPTTRPARRVTDVDVVVLGCVSSKGRGPAPAKDLYVSPLWRKRRAYAESTGKPWVIFSAKHGIIDPDTSIDWYDVALARLPATDRTAKGEQAVAQLEARFGPLTGMAFEIHAGSAYANALAAPLKAHGADLKNPLAGRTIGYHLQWYGQSDDDADA